MDLKSNIFNSDVKNGYAVGSTPEVIFPAVTNKMYYVDSITAYSGTDSVINIYSDTDVIWSGFVKAGDTALSTCFKNKLLGVHGEALKAKVMTGTGAVTLIAVLK